MGVIVRRHDGHEIVVKWNDGGRWSSNGVVLWLEWRQNGDAVEMIFFIPVEGGSRVFWGG
jgi:hypothetical protein